jgi:hypothetical protein
MKPNQSLVCWFDVGKTSLFHDPGSDVYCIIDLQLVNAFSPSLSELRKDPEDSFEAELRSQTGPWSVKPFCRRPQNETGSRTRLDMHALPNGRTSFFSTEVGSSKPSSNSNLGPSGVKIACFSL